MNSSFRLFTALISLCAFITFGVSLYLQYSVGLTPCPLCLLARFLVLVIALLALVACLHNPGKRGKVAWAISIFTTALMGIAIAVRHLWILQLPPEKVPACTPGLDYLLDTLPIFEAVLVVLNGSGECAQQEGQLFNVSLPTWTLGFFVLMAVGIILAIYKQKKG